MAMDVGETDFIFNRLREALPLYRGFDKILVSSTKVNCGWLA